MISPCAVGHASIVFTAATGISQIPLAVSRCHRTIRSACCSLLLKNSTMALYTRTFHRDLCRFVYAQFLKFAVRHAGIRLANFFSFFCIEPEQFGAQRHDLLPIGRPQQIFPRQFSSAKKPDNRGEKEQVGFARPLLGAQQHGQYCFPSGDSE